MTISSFQTLLVFLSIFGIIGFVRAIYQEVWTLVGVALTLILLFFSGNTFFEQLPLHIWAGILSLSGNQSASDSAVSHKMGEPWTGVMLIISLVVLVTLSYLVGGLIGGKQKITTFGEHFFGGFMGALSGILIGIFVFSQPVLQSGLVIQFPTYDLTKNGVAPYILIAFFVGAVAFGVSKLPKPASSK